jgi:hypothetical protein
LLFHVRRAGSFSAVWNEMVKRRTLPIHCAISKIFRGGHCGCCLARQVTKVT